MSVNLRFHEAHKSIHGLCDVDLPNFSVITGVNGAGKSHLLSAIQNGNVRIEGNEKRVGVKSFDFNSFIPKVENSSSPLAVREKRESAIKNIWNSRKKCRDRIEKALPQISGLHPRFADLEVVILNRSDVLRKMAIEENDLAKDMQAELEIEKSLGRFNKVVSAQENAFRQQLAQYGNLVQKLNALAVEKDCTLLSLSMADIEQCLAVFWGDHQLLQLKLADWFSAWHAEFEYNRLNRFYAENDGETNRKYLSDAEFKRRFGPEPWTLTNSFFERHGVRHRFNRPEHKIENLNNQFKLVLTDQETNAQISAADLSSGEKIILAITLLLYQTKEEAIATELPKLLLLDEVDAPLHPTFVRSLMEVLNDEIVGRCGVPVIMTTHSPSTVALAPEGSVFELVRGHTHKLRPITASMATQKLSEGYITLSSNDVMVIVESGIDVRFYEAVYEALSRKALLAPHPKLTFIPASRSKNINGGGGCTQVRSWAPKLSGLEIARFRGLIDRDAGAQADQVVSVLKRYSIENYLFDPLTLLGLLLQRGLRPPSTCDYEYPLGCAEFLALSNQEIQGCLDAFMDWFSGQITDPDFDCTMKVKVDYLQWSEVLIPAWFIEKKGHELEPLILAVLNPLHKPALLRKGDYSPLIHFQTVESPGLISKDFVEIFNTLQQSSDEEAEGELEKVENV